MILDIEEHIEINELIGAENAIAYPHTGLWGDFNFSLDGSMDCDINGNNYLSTISYAMWIPPGIRHDASMMADSTVHYICIRISPQLSKAIKNEFTLLTLTPFLISLVKEILYICSTEYDLEQYRNLLRVLYDQIRTARPYENYLTHTNHMVLKPILEVLGDPNSFDQSTQSQLRQFKFTERHLLRLSKLELGVSLIEWRKRAKVLYAINQLKKGEAVKKISLELGYSSSSNFIYFFKAKTGLTPTQIKSTK